MSRTTSPSHEGTSGLSVRSVGARSVCRRASTEDGVAPIQGGPYVSAGVGSVLKGLASDGVTGLGQSSWGPTGFAFADSEAEGEKLLAAARRYGEGAKLRFELARGRNAPAAIEAR